MLPEGQSCGPFYRSNFVAAVWNAGHGQCTGAWRESKSFISLLSEYMNVLIRTGKTVSLHSERQFAISELCEKFITARSAFKAWVFSGSVAGIAGSNPAAGMAIYLL